MKPARRLRRIGRAGRPSAPATPGPPSTLLELARGGPAPLTRGDEPVSPPLKIAVVIPSFRRGSGGHATIVNLMRELSRRGHAVALWLEDWEQRHASEPAAVTQASFAEFFAAHELPLHTDLSEWSGADVALATGWQTVPRTLLLADVRARAYLVQDHEPDFYGASAEALWAAQTYRQGLHCVAASPWLAELLRTNYGAGADHFDLAVDHAVYRPTGGTRRDDLVVFYSRALTARRAVPLGLLALRELKRRRPELEIALFGEDRALTVGFEHVQLGILDARRLADLYSQATVGMVLSLTNPSLICLEMMACGLPCVELSSEPMLATFADTGQPTLAAPDPISLCDAIESLLDDRDRRRAAAAEGAKLTATRSWARAAKQLESSLLAVSRSRDQV